MSLVLQLAKKNTRDTIYQFVTDVALSSKVGPQRDMYLYIQMLLF